MSGQIITLDKNPLEINVGDHVKIMTVSDNPCCHDSGHFVVTIGEKVLYGVTKIEISKFEVGSKEPVVLKLEMDASTLVMTKQSKTWGDLAV